MNNEKYNGWANYETWNVALWYNNDETIYDMIYEMIKHKQPDDLTESAAREVIIDAFSNFDLKQTPDDVKLSSKEINWNEIAEDLKEMI
jgi:hypothetical protein